MTNCGKLVSKDGCYYIIHGYFDYEVRETAIRDLPDLINWISFLSDKNWVSEDIKVEFINFVLRDKGWTEPAQVQVIKDALAENKAYISWCQKINAQGTALYAARRRVHA